MSEHPTYHQIEQQNGKATYPTVLIERSDKTITTGSYEGLDEVTGKYTIGVDGGDRVRQVAADLLTDKHQASLAERLAGKPLLQAEMGHSAVTASVEVQARQETSEEVSAAIDALLADLTTEDKNYMFQHFRHMEDKLAAQRANNGRESEQAGQFAGQAERAMSETAKAKKDTYVSMMRKLSRLRDRENPDV